VLAHADELYLRSVIWANTAAESLFGEAPAAPAPERGPQTGPEAAAPPTAPVLVSLRPEGGALRRIGAAFSGFFRRLAGRTA
jgi:hypothetical protein